MSRGRPGWLESRHRECSSFPYPSRTSSRFVGCDALLLVNSTSLFPRNQPLHLRDGDAVEVSDDGEFECAGRDREMQRSVGCPLVEQSEDETGGERVTTTDAFDPIDDGSGPSMQRPARGIVENGAP